MLRRPVETATKCGQFINHPQEAVWQARAADHHQDLQACHSYRNRSRGKTRFTSSGWVEGPLFLRMTSVRSQLEPPLGADPPARGGRAQPHRWSNHYFGTEICGSGQIKPRESRRPRFRVAHRHVAPRSMTCHFESKPRSDPAGARFVAQSCRRCLVAKRIRIITAPPAIIGSGGDCAGGSGRAVICASMHSPVYSCNAHWHKRPSYSGVGFSAGRDLGGEFRRTEAEMPRRSEMLSCSSSFGSQ